MLKRSRAMSMRSTVTALCAVVAAIAAWGFVRIDDIRPLALTPHEIARHDEIAYWELTARFPQIADATSLPERRLNEAVRSWVDGFVDHAERTMATHPVWEMGDGPSEARLDYTVAHPAPDVVEITFRSHIDYGVDFSAPSVARLRVDLRSGAVTAEPASSADGNNCGDGC